MATSIDFGKVFGSITEGFIKLPLAQKIMIPLLIVGSIMGILYVAKWANVPQYTVLFSDLKPVDSSAVINKLKEKKIKYEVRDGGTAVAISPADKVHEIRMELAGDGIPQGGVVGYESLETPRLGQTGFMEKVFWQRAVQGELERTISSLNGVSAVRVHIALPEKSVFARKGSDATASVMLQLQTGHELDKKQIKGIANLVAGSVEGLKRENVTIVDVNGNLLSAQEENEESLTVEATRLQYQREIERGYAQRVEQMLIKVLGEGKVIARVTADMDYSQTDREEESFDPGGQVLRSERTVEEGTGASQRGGIPGVVSNLSNDPNLLAPAGGGAQDKSSHREAVKNYEVSRAVSKTSSPRGKLVRLSAAVLVDGTYETPAGASANAPKVFKPLDSDTMTRIEGLVKSAVGFDAARGDSMTVENIPFHVSEIDFTKEMNEQKWVIRTFQALPMIGTMLFGLLVILFAVRPIVKFMTTAPDAEVDLTRLLPTGIKELEQELEAERAKVSTVPNFEPSVDMDQLEELMAQNSRVVKENPQQAALLIRYWLNDGRF